MADSLMAALLVCFGMSFFGALFRRKIWVAALVGLLEAEKEALENEKVALKARCEALVQQVKAQEAALGAFPKPPSTSG